MRKMLHHGGEQKIETCLTNHISQALDDVAHLVGAVGSELKTELDNKDGGLRDEVDVGKIFCRSRSQQRGFLSLASTLHKQSQKSTKLLIWNRGN